MASDRWLRLSAAAGVLLLAVTAGAVAGQLRARQETARLRAQLTALERRPRGPMEPGVMGPMGAMSPVRLSRVRIVEPGPSPKATEQPPPPGEPGPGALDGAARPSAPSAPGPTGPERVAGVDVEMEPVAGGFAVDVTVTNRSTRTLTQPILGLLVITDPEKPKQPVEIQQRQATIETLAPGDSSTVRLEGFEARNPRLIHEIVVSTLATDPARPTGTVVKLVPRVLAPTPPPARQPSPAPGPTPPTETAPREAAPQPSEPAPPAPPQQPPPGGPTPAPPAESEPAEGVPRPEGPGSSLKTAG